MNDTPYLTLMGKLWGVFHELYEEKWPRYIENPLYDVSLSSSSLVMPYGNIDMRLVQVMACCLMAPSYSLNQC